MAIDYRLKPLGKTCHVTGKPLQPGETCYSAVVPQGGEFVRLDFSEEGWTQPPGDALGYWKCVVPDETKPKTNPLDTESLLQSFEQLCEENNPARDKLKYILALLLIQKRRLLVEEPHEKPPAEQPSLLQLIGSHGEGPFEVREYELSDEERQELQQTLNAFLASESAPSESEN